MSMRRRLDPARMPPKIMAAADSDSALDAAIN